MIWGKRPWCWEGLGAGGERDDRGWDGWMASPTQWTWVWMNSGSWRWTGRPGVLQFMGSQRVGHDWATELNWLKTSLFSIGHFWGVPTPPNSLLLGMPWHFQPHCEHWDMEWSWTEGSNTQNMGCDFQDQRFRFCSVLVSNLYSVLSLGLFFNLKIEELGPNA